MRNDQKKVWEEACRQELAVVRPLLAELGYTLENDQPHMGGERYLMQAVTTAGGRKLILLGRDSEGNRVVIKATRDPAGREELAHERLCRSLLSAIPFAYSLFAVPEERLYAEKRGYVISVQAYLDQELPFTERPTPEQFAIALRSFKAQEGAHAATYGHIKAIGKTFGRRTVRDYLEAFKDFRQGVGKVLNEPELNSLLNEAEAFLRENARTIAQYGDFLTHTDFVPHNIRVVGDTVYLLDLSSLRFGNKYEGWARFANFMELYNPELTQALLMYVRENRSPEELLSFKLMRVYRLGEIIWYYVNTLERSSGDLYTLNRARITWWAEVLKAVCEDRTPSRTDRQEYIDLRDRLRSADEKRRQQNLH